jgi:hypothetical protein
MRGLSAFQVQRDAISAMDAQWIQMTGHLFRKTIPRATSSHVHQIEVTKTDI